MNDKKCKVCAEPANDIFCKACTNDAGYAEIASTIITNAIPKKMGRPSAWDPSLGLTKLQTCRLPGCFFDLLKRPEFKAELNVLLMKWYNKGPL